MSRATTIMLHVDVNDSEDDEGCRTFYGPAVASVSLFLCLALSSTLGVTKACAITGTALLFFLAISCFLPVGRGRSAAAPATAVLPRYACACEHLSTEADIKALPSQAYERPADEKPGGDGGAPCPVCLEDLQGGEVVRRLPACGHLFHKECVDMWLHSHNTCPLCRRELFPRRCAASTASMDSMDSEDSSSHSPAFRVVIIGL